MDRHDGAPAVVRDTATPDLARPSTSDAVTVSAWTAPPRRRPDLWGRRSLLAALAAAPLALAGSWGARREVHAADEPGGAIVVARTKREAAAVVNRLAPEHLVCERREDVGRFTAGTISVGRWSAQAAGDYCTGSNHVLPTGGAARFRGGLSAADFVRVYAVQILTERGIRTIGPPAMTLAEAEGLTAHAASIRRRLTAPARRTEH